MKFKIFPILVLSFGLLSCEKPSLHTMQYAIRPGSANQASFSVTYETPTGATKSTGILPRGKWESEIFRDVPEGFRFRIELEAQGKVSTDILVLKDGSDAYRNQVRSPNDSLILSGKL